MALHSFTLHVEGISTANPHYENALFNEGCTDALITVVDGELALDFDREAPTYDLAVHSASRAVERAGGRVTGIDRITY
jgi:hypothetical protein